MERVVHWAVNPVYDSFIHFRFELNQAPDSSSERVQLAMKKQSPGLCRQIFKGILKISGFKIFSVLIAGYDIFS